ncbi:MAG: hypothetical protein AAF616_05845 [Bacteroidota bacterium]
MIKNIDFTPQVTKKGGLFKSTQMQGFSEVVDQMNEWIKESNPDVINIETVVLPNMFDPDEEGSEDTMIGAGGQSNVLWHQFIRVWYR